MDKATYWKNFSLGTELELSGNFIYNGLLVLDQMKSFYHEEEIFEFLYNISIGVERLEKVAIVLLEHDLVSNQIEFEESLITHSHLDLLKRVKRNCHIRLGKIHNKFLQLLGQFYKSIRYDRFNLSSADFYDKERRAFINFIQDGLNLEIKNEHFKVTPNDKRIRKFVGNIIGKIAMQLYRIIEREARKSNIYTYEIRYNSKAAKIFLSEEFTFERESILRKEILINLLTNKNKSCLRDFVNQIGPLRFDQYEENYYLKCLLNISEASNHIDELESLYESVKNPKKRIEMIGSDFSLEEDDDEE